GSDRPCDRVEWIAVVSAADGLRYMEEDFCEGDRSGVAEVERYRILLDGVVGIAEVPGEVVIVSEDVAARARSLAVARKPRGVVEHRPPLDHRRWFRIGQRRFRDLLLRGEIDHFQRVVEASHHV